MKNDVVSGPSSFDIFLIVPWAKLYFNPCIAAPFTKRSLDFNLL
jgi:hypothetical protein